MDRGEIGIRRAGAADQPGIRALVHGERLNANDLHWSNFLVAAANSDVVGTLRMRIHPDGSRELGSLVVSRELRGQGVATRLIDAMLAEERAPMWAVMSDAFAQRYRRWGFLPIDAASAPVRVRRSQRTGSLARIVSLLSRRPMRRLVILERL